MKLVVVCGSENAEFRHVANLFPDYINCGWAEAGTAFGEIIVRPPTNQVQQINHIIALGKDSVLYTHSDVVFLAIRLAIKQKRISHEDVVFYFVTGPVSIYRTDTVHRIKCDADGRIENWPKGFFDQMENLLSHLL